MSARVAFCVTCEQTASVEWIGQRWRYAMHQKQVPVGIAVRHGDAVGVAVKAATCTASGNVLPPGVFTGWVGNGEQR